MVPISLCNSLAILISHQDEFEAFTNIDEIENLNSMERTIIKNKENEHLDLGK